MAPLGPACSGTSAAAAEEDWHARAANLPWGMIACLGEEVCFQADKVALWLYRVQPVQVLVQQQLRGLRAEVSGRHAVPAAAGRFCRPCCSQRG